MANVIYRRVSTVEQSLDRQDFQGIKADKVFEEKASGKDIKGRPQLNLCLEYIREGDHLYVYELSRLSRSLIDANDLVQRITEKGATLHILKEGLVFKPNCEADPTSKFLLNLWANLAQWERETIRLRQAEGIAKAKARNAYEKNGRPTITEETLGKVKALVEGGMMVTKALKVVGLSRVSFYKYFAVTKDADGKRHCQRKEVA